MEIALPEHVQKNIDEFVAAARGSLKENLVSAALFGSAAEGRLRSTSDVNMILVLKEFRADQVDPLREPLRLAHAAIRLSVMFLLQSELAQASDAFAVKFHDIHDRHRVLYGADLFQGIQIPRAATLFRLQQVLLNLVLRLRERYALLSLREDQLALAFADAVGPLRASAATIVDLKSGRHLPPKEALQELCREIPGSWSKLLGDLSEAREKGDLPPGRAAPATLEMISLLQGMQECLRRLG